MSARSHEDLQRVHAAQGLIRGAFESFGKKIIATTSFGATAGLLIHFIGEWELPIMIVHVNTGFLFPETLEYREALKERYKGLEFIELRPDLSRDSFLKRYGREIRNTDPDLCCRINKVEPLKAYLKEHRIKAWITAVRRHQTEFRSGLRHIEILENGRCKVMPFLDWDSRLVHNYMKENNIPFHPLYEQGYTSIGCEPCTSLPFCGDERSGRWKGKSKKECGLHCNIC